MAPTIKSKNLKPKTNTVNMGVAMPTGYLDPGEINSAGPPGVPPTIVPTKTAAPKLGGPLAQRQIGAKLQRGAITPSNEGKMQNMIESSTAKIGQASGGDAKTPEQSAVDNKKYKSLLKQFGLT